MEPRLYIQVSARTGARLSLMMNSEARQGHDQSRHHHWSLSHAPFTQWLNHKFGDPETLQNLGSYCKLKGTSHVLNLLVPLMAQKWNPCRTIMKSNQQWYIQFSVILFCIRSNAS